jgi:hypothetical protein
MRWRARLRKVAGAPRVSETADLRPAGSLTSGSYGC